MPIAAGLGFGFSWFGPSSLRFFCVRSMSALVTDRAFLRASRTLGVEVAGQRQWKQRRHFGALSRTVANASPDVVFVAGLIDTGAGRLIADLRAAIGRRVPVLATDGVLPISKLFAAAGPAARGVRVSFPGCADEGLPPAGRHFLAQFGATQAGGRVDEAAVYAAQATMIMLDAIARSDGTRASVRTQLLRSRVGGGLLGSFRFDANGDPTVRPVTILRVKRGGGDDRVTSHDGASIERVVYPKPGLGG